MAITDVLVAPTVKKKCAAGYLCEADPSANLEASTHSCFYCSKKIHCAMWCGKSWMDVMKTTSITIGSLSLLGPREKVKTGDHESLTMCHLCIRTIIQDTIAIMVPSTKSSSLANDADVVVDEDDSNSRPADTSTLPSKPKEWKLISPPESRCVYWGKFMRFDLNHHPEKKNVAVCILCMEDSKHKEIKMKTGNTAGLKSHLQSIHVSVYDELCVADAANKASKTNKTTTISSIFKQKLQLSDLKHLYTMGAAICIIDNSLPLSIVESNSWRTMFVPLHRDARNIVNISSRAVREQTLHLGRIARQATILEMRGIKMAVTTDHWTGADQLTYGAVTAHHIDKDWKMASVLIDFKVFEGRTTGALIFEDISSVLDKYKIKINHDGLALGATVDSGGGANNTMDAIIDEPIDTIVVTDTTSNMGKLGEFLRSDKREHGYCFAHLLHLVAGIAFDRKSYIVCIQLLLSNPNSLYSTVIASKKCARGERSDAEIEVGDRIL
jgi:hypothetical protein